MNKRGNKEKVAQYILISIFALLALFPLVWVILTSLKSKEQIFSIADIFPRSITVDNYINVLFKAKFLVYFNNSVIVAVISTVISIFLSVTCAYGLTRYHIRGGNKLKMAILYTRMFPGVLLAIPYYVIMRSLRLGDTLLGLVFIYCSFTLPFCIWNVQTFFEKLPWELEEAASIDGANKFRTLISIMLPIAKPGIVATALYSFMMSWDEFMFANLFITSTEKKTISLGIQSFIGEYSTDWGSLMGAAVISLIPIIIFFAVAQKSLVGGLSAGAVKG